MKRYKAQEEIIEEQFIEPEEEPEPIIEDVDDGVDEIFPQEYMEPLRGLLFLGKQENEVSYGGHRFLLRTLTEGELLRVGQLCKPYMDTMSELEARRLYIVAASIEAVDGSPLVTQYREGEDLLYEKAEQIKNWYPAVVSFLFNEYVALEQTAIQVSNALKK